MTAVLPRINLNHVVRLTDDVGILQHATYFVPNRRFGYCTDDNARALIVASCVRGLVEQDPLVDDLLIRYLSFVQHAFDPALGKFRNLKGYDRRWLEDVGSPDSNGRAIWALGVAACEPPDERMRGLAAEILRTALSHLEAVPDLRTVAFVSLGLDSYLTKFGDDVAAIGMRRTMAERLVRAYKAESVRDEWLWYEPFLTYANARIPHALLSAGASLERSDMIDIALRSLIWLIDVKTNEDGQLCPVGNHGWYVRGGEQARYDQQPIEADALVAACARAFTVTGDRAWLERLNTCFEWFLGRNDANIVLYDAGTGGCRDGLHESGANENQGAESTLAWLSALCTMIRLRNEGHWVDEDQLHTKAAEAVPTATPA